MDNFIPVAQKTKKIYFTYGRFQPPHSGHQLLINNVVNLAKKNGADYLIFVSSSLNKPNWKSSKQKDASKNPLPVSLKIDVLQKMFPGLKFVDGSLYGNQILKFITEMQNKGYTDITGVFGGVRADEFQKLFDKYAPGTKIVQIDRDEEKSVSATKMRNAAFNDYPFFEKHAKLGNMTSEDVLELRKNVTSALSFGKYSFGKQSVRSVLSEIRYLIHLKI